MVRVLQVGETPYCHAMSCMASWHAERCAGHQPDRLFLLTHPPTITHGRRVDPTTLPTSTVSRPVLSTDRGGSATYHGPGQIIGYLVADVSRHRPADVVSGVCRTVAAALQRHGFDAHAHTDLRLPPQLSGVWTERNRKIASIGMRIERGVSRHGFALNVETDLAEFRRFSPCGLAGETMTSLREMAEDRGVSPPSVPEVMRWISHVFQAVDIEHITSPRGPIPI
ncbi:lipoyl(octanoyl) transferase LipB [Flexivirga sp. ID2601S]|uniref:Octanoyltransferase n=1 Tax=Flexivirga aerilata TaxID=1656889 RepID=A0A849ACY4_9MICO|nr:lipoyl(octanoyl) transferase LipB [Flexivirga aerilata]